MPEPNEFLSNLAVALDHTLNVVVALRLAVDEKAGMTDSLKAAYRVCAAEPLCIG